MVDLTAREEAAIRATLQPVAALIDTIGWQSPPSAWSQEQMLQLITVAIDGFQTAMHQAAVDDPMEVPF
ncbi:MAG: DUF6511 domain-containing protein [Novosphingobium sp.]